MINYEAEPKLFQAYVHVRILLKDLPAGMYFHNWHKNLTVFAMCSQIGEHACLDISGTLIIKLAALFQDVGYKIMNTEVFKWLKFLADNFYNPGIIKKVTGVYYGNKSPSKTNKFFRINYM